MPLTHLHPFLSGAMPCWWRIHKLAILKGTETNQRKQLNGSHQTEGNTHHEDPCASLELLSKDPKRGLLPLALLSLENRDLKMLSAIFPPPQRRRSSTGKTQHSDGDHLLLYQFMVGAALHLKWSGALQGQE